MYTYTHAHIHAHTHTHARTQTHTHTHTHTRKQRQLAFGVSMAHHVGLPCQNKHLQRLGAELGACSCGAVGVMGAREQRRGGEQRQGCKERRLHLRFLRSQEVLFLRTLLYLVVTLPKFFLCILTCTVG